MARKLFFLIMTVIGLLVPTVAVGAADGMDFSGSARLLGYCLDALSVLAVLGMASVLLAAHLRFRRRREQNK